MNDRLLKESDVLMAIDRRIEELSQDPVFIRKNGNIDVIGVKKYILAIPSVERPQGKWIRNNLTGTFKVWDCSECGIHMETTWNFCPNCGCDMQMKGVDDE